jgi:hypothetical protein
MATMKNTVIAAVVPGSAEALRGHTHSVACKLCGEKTYGDSVRILANWIKEHRCVPNATAGSP